MDIKEIAIKVARKVDPDFQGLPSDRAACEFAEALISAYKAELLKEVGEPVAVTNHAQLGYVTDGMHPDIPLAMWAKETSYSGANIALYTSDQVAAAILKATKPLEEEIERLKGIKNVQLDIYPNDAGTKQQREVDGSLEMGQLLAESKNEETGNPKAERAKSLVWMHTGDGHIADSSGKRIGIFSGDFKHRDRLICAVNSESDLLAQLAKAEQLWQAAQGRCDGLEEKLAKAEQRVADACSYLAHQHMDADIAADAINNGEWRKFVKEV